MTPLRALMTRVIDYAGLFPPAGLDMPSAVRNYARYVEGEHRWALGRFVLPASRLVEFEEACFEIDRQGPWHISTIGIPEDQLQTGCGTVDTVELKAGAPESIVEAMRGVPEHVVPYFEIPLDRDPRNLVEAIAHAGARAKLRTGGLNPEAVPSSTDLARFLACCAEYRVSFKATAGLHHPVRAGNMHGFVNLCLAASLVFFGAGEADAVDTLEETSPQRFQLDDECARWHGHGLTPEQIHVARETFFISFGSCSFEEPLSDLAALGWL